MNLNSQLVDCIQVHKIEIASFELHLSLINEFELFNNENGAGLKEH